MRLEANPNYYDYIRSINLESTNKCKFICGSGQSIHLDAKGKYSLKYEKYTKNIIFEIGDKKFKKKFKVEYGLFILQHEIIWDSIIADWPFSVATKQYIFEEDPFEDLYQDIDSSSRGTAEENKRVFYDREDIIEKSIKYLNSVELHAVKNKYPIFYKKYIETPNGKL